MSVQRTPGEDRLTSGELMLLQTLAQSDSAALARRARIVLGWNEGLEPGEIASRVNLSERTVTRWLRAFITDRLAIFPEEALAEARTLAQSVGEEPSPPAGDPRLPTVADLCHRYQVDMPHARHVGHLAAGLFDLTRPVHQLDGRYRDVVFTAGVLHNIAFAGGVAKHHTRGRDIILENPLADLDDADRALIAVTTAFHRKAWKPKRLEKEPAYTALEPGSQAAVLALAALVRIADGLDYSQSQTTVLGPSTITAGEVRVTVAGPFAESDAARAAHKSDMWHAVYDVPITITLYCDEGLARPVHEPPIPQTPGVLPGDRMSEAGRKVLRFHFERMLAHEPGTREGADIEALHDMRVATRRMRAAFRVFGAYYEPQVAKRLLRELRRTTTALGEVRDLDVFMENAQLYLAGLPAERAHELDVLFKRWQKQREKARNRMLAYLDGEAYQEFVRDFREFVDTPGLGSLEPDGPAPVYVRHVAPRQIYERYEEVRAYEPLLEDAPIEVLHALRITGKWLRYTLEFFREVLGDEAEDVIKIVIGLQDHLGALHDADVARLLLQKHLAKLQTKARQQQARGGGPETPAGLEEIAAYLEDRQQALLHLQQTFSAIWEQVVAAETRRMLALAVSVL